MKKTYFNIIIIILSAVIFLLFAVSTEGFDNLIHQMTNVKLPWILLAASCMLVYWFLDSLILNIFGNFLNVKQSIRDTFNLTMIGQFVNSITPFFSGGQPAQVYFMVKKNINGGTASSILAMKLIVYQAVLVLYSFIVIIFRFNFFKQNLSNLFYVSILGFVLNFAVILLLVIASVNKKVTKVIIMGIFNFLSKIRIVKDVNKLWSKIENDLERFHKNSKLITQNIKILFSAIILTAIQLTSYFIIPYFIYRGFNFNLASFWNMLAAATFLNMIVNIIPLPGASGGSEGGFYLIFSMFFTGGSVMSAILLWRIITYYFCIGAGSIFTIMEQNITSGKVLRHIKINN